MMSDTIPITEEVLKAVEQSLARIHREKCERLGCASCEHNGKSTSAHAVECLGCWSREVN